MSRDLFAEAKAKFKFPPGPEIEDYTVMRDYKVAKAVHQAAKDQVQKERDTWMDHKRVIEAEKVAAEARAAAAAHTEAEAAKDNNNKKRCLADTARSQAKEVAVSILTGNDRCGQCVVKSLFVSVPSFPNRG